MTSIIDLTQDGDSSPQPATRRQTRSSTRTLRSQTSTLHSSSPQPRPNSTIPSRIPIPLTSRLRNGAGKPLLRKWEWLRSHTVIVPRNINHDPVSPTLVFGQDEGGTAVCISPSGVLLTCAHCVAERQRDLDLTKSHLLLFASGEAVEATVLAWDGQRDLALLVITETPESPKTYPYMPISNAALKLNTRLLCIGHPGSEDLETSIPGIQTGYDTLVLSEGTFKGIAIGQDPQDNSEIGALMHNCWTYWGHSGAPLIDRKSGGLVGLHSSWDDETGMRRGVAFEAIDSFLKEFEGRGRGGPEGWKWCVRLPDSKEIPHRGR